MYGGNKKGQMQRSVIDAERLLIQSRRLVQMGNNQPRSFKFYRKNEKEVMKSLGLKPTKNSGSGWIEKEDGQNDYVICQLKSTDAQSIKVNQKDIRTLEKNAMIEHKIPMFAIQFLNTGEVWLMIKPEDLPDASEYILNGSIKENRSEQLGIDLEASEDLRTIHHKSIKSSYDSREMFHKQESKKYNKKRSAL